LSDHKKKPDKQTLIGLFRCRRNYQSLEQVEVRSIFNIEPVDDPYRTTFKGIIGSGTPLRPGIYFPGKRSNAFAKLAKITAFSEQSRNWSAMTTESDVGKEYMMTFSEGYSVVTKSYQHNNHNHTISFFHHRFTLMKELMTKPQFS
jgi:hypothetical protein